MVKTLKHYGYITTLKIPKKDIQKIEVMMAKQPKENIYEFVERLKKEGKELPSYIMNGGYFHMRSGKTLTATMDEGKRTTDVRYGYGFDFGLRIWKNGKMDFGTMAYPIDLQLKDYLGGSPPLVEHGKRIYEFSKTFTTGRQPRGAIGDNSNDFYMVAFDGRRPHLKGATVPITAWFMQEKLNCDNAISVDGGYSLWLAKIVNGKVIPINEPYGRRQLDSFVGVYLTEEAKRKTEDKSIDYTSFPTLRKGAKGKYVAMVQEKLMELGYDLPKYGADGDYGNETYSAIVRFQKDKGLVVDGIVGQQTYSRLFA